MAGRRVILLGAGASRGAAFGFPSSVEPPLNRDFFTQLQRITTKHTKLVRQVMRDVVDLFGANFSLTLEDYFTQLEFLISTAEGMTSASDGLKLARDLRRKRDRLMAALSAVLEASTNRAIAGSGSQGCRYHRLIAAHLVPGDLVISFNYDCVMDDALRREGGDRWSAHTGYDFGSRYTVEPSGARFWTPSGTGRIPLAKTIRLLKLHGSVHWQLPAEGTSVKLKQRLHQQYGTPRFDIIPPQWNKSLRTPIFRHLWRSAFRAVQRAEQIAILGFSFTPTDLHVESLFRLALGGAPLRTLVIVNPSAADRERIRRVFAGSLARSRTVVREYNDLAAFAAAWPDGLDA